MVHVTRCLLVFLFLLVLAPVAWAQSGFVVKAESGAKLRSGASTSHAVLASIPAGTRVKVVEQGANGWHKVEYQGQTGYVSAPLLEKDNGQARSNNAANNSSANKARTNQGGNSRSSAGGGGHTWGLGLRGGDPAGLTIKKYRGNGSALEVVVGRSFRWGYKYGDRFYRYDRFSDRDVYDFRGYKRNATTALQVHYLLHKDISGAKGLQFYYGIGGQARFTPVFYTYRYKDYYGSRKDQFDYRTATERVTDLDLGVDGVLGLEYTFQDIPFSIFADANVFVEIFDAPFWFSGQSGVGIRYNFR